MKIKRQDTSIPVFSYVMDIFLFSHPLQLLITQHSLVQFFLHPVNEIGAAFVLPAFDISVEAVAVFRINPEYLIEKWGELFERHIAVVDAAQFFANYIHVRTQKTKCNFPSSVALAEPT